MYTCFMNSRATELRIASGLFLLLAFLFFAFPEIDLAASDQFFDDGRWAFSGGNWPLFEWLYRGIPRLGQGFLGLVGLGLLLGCLRPFRRLRAQRRLLAFILTGALLGPILLVDVTLKDQWGRARPTNTTVFNGTKQFSPAFVLVEECKKNCSFVSGHVASASFIMVFGWLGTSAMRRRWLLASLAAGSLLAVVRMSAGGHFLSDTIFAWFATYYGLWLTEIFFRWRGWLPPPPNDKAERST